MPLTVDCICADTDGVQACALSSLNFVVQLGHNACASAYFDLLGGPTEYHFGTDWGPRTQPLTPIADWLAAWNDISVAFGQARTLSSTIIETGHAEFYIEATYTCTSPGGPTTSVTVRAKNSETQQDSCYDGSVLLKFGALTSGIVNGAIFRSGPLESCNSWDVAGGLFTPLIPDRQVIDVYGSTSPICICPSGGSPPYFFEITDGRIPTGQLLDPVTGCITGEPTGTDRGTPEITVKVTDTVVGEEGLVTCLFVRCVTTDDTGNMMF